MYKPEHTLTLDKKPFVQKRIALQGWGGTSKTTAALTFPNPCVLDFDNSVSETNALCAGRALADVSVIPFYDQSFVEKCGSKNRRDAFKNWLPKNITKFQPDQTLVLDSWTALLDEFYKAWQPVMTKRGEIDEFAFWDMLQEFAQDTLSTLRQAPCDVIVIFHEVIETDDKGKPTGKATPLMQGKFVNKLSGYFTDWFRSIGVERKPDDEQMPKNLGITSEQWKRFCAMESPIRSNTLYMWQTATGNVANCKTKLIGLPRFVPAGYDVFVNTDKYK